MIRFKFPQTPQLMSFLNMQDNYYLPTPFFSSMKIITPFWEDQIYNDEKLWTDPTWSLALSIHWDLCMAIVVTLSYRWLKGTKVRLHSVKTGKPAELWCWHWTWTRSSRKHRSVGWNSLHNTSENVYWVSSSVLTTHSPKPWPKSRGQLGQSTLVNSIDRTWTYASCISCDYIFQVQSENVCRTVNGPIIKNDLFQNPMWRLIRL